VDATKFESIDGIAIDPLNEAFALLLVIENGNNQIAKVALNDYKHPITNLAISYESDVVNKNPSSITIDHLGKFAYMTYGGGTNVVRKMDMSTGTITTITDFTSDFSQLNTPTKIVVDPLNEKLIYVCDSSNNAIRKINMDEKTMTTVVEQLNGVVTMAVDMTGTRMLIVEDKNTVKELYLRTNEMNEIRVNTSNYDVELNEITDIVYSFDGKHCLILDKKPMASIYKMNLGQYLTYYDGTYTLINEIDIDDVLSFDNSDIVSQSLPDPIDVKAGDVLGLYVETSSESFIAGFHAETESNAGCNATGHLDRIKCTTPVPPPTVILPIKQNITNVTNITNITISYLNITAFDNNSTNSSTNTSLISGNTSETIGINSDGSIDTGNYTSNITANNFTMVLNVTNQTETTETQFAKLTSNSSLRKNVSIGLISFTEFFISGYVEPHRPFESVVTVQNVKKMSLKMRLTFEVAIFAGTSMKEIKLGIDSSIHALCIANVCPISYYQYETKATSCYRFAENLETKVSKVYLKKTTCLVVEVQTENATISEKILDKLQRWTHDIENIELDLLNIPKTVIVNASNSNSSVVSPTVIREPKLILSGYETYNFVTKIFNKNVYMMDNTIQKLKTKIAIVLTKELCSIDTSKACRCAKVGQQCPSNCQKYFSECDITPNDVIY
jgi:K+/H+ antiporter YhaU regulatory subunit KhtT